MLLLFVCMIIINILYCKSRSLEERGSQKQQRINDAQRKRVAELETEIERFSESEKRWKEETNILENR